MKKIYYLILSSILLINTIQAQENFKQGYIIKNNGDTITGLIDFRTTKMNNTQCKYKDSENGHTIVYKPGDIAGYRFVNEGKYYVSKEVVLANNLPQAFFMEYLISGMLNLYHIESDNAIYYVFEDENGKQTLVSKDNKEQIVYENGKYINQQDLKYVGMLSYVFKDAPSVMQKVNKHSINEKNIIELTKEYHNQMCTSGAECVVFEGKQDKKYYNISFSVYGGVKGNKYHNYSSDQRVSSTTFYSPTLGVEIDVVIPRWNENISYLFDLSVTKLKKKDIDIDSWLYQGRIGGRYTFNKKGRVQPNVDCAFTLYSANGGDYTTVGWSLGAGINIVTFKKQYVFLRSDYMIICHTQDNEFRGPRFNLGYSF